MEKRNEYVLRNGMPMTEAQRKFAEKRMEGIRKILRGEPKPKPAEAEPVKGEVLQFPPKLSEQELIRRQQIIDQTWALTLARRRELELEMERTCHRGPLDSDADL